MKTAILITLIAASLTAAEVTWTFAKFEGGVEVPLEDVVGPPTEFQSNAAQRVSDARKRNRFNRRTDEETVTTENWCGAVLLGSGFSVVGTWTVPAITLRAGQSSSGQPAVAQWVGIDGLTNGALIQGGTHSEFVDGQQQNVAWTEMLPASAGILSFTIYTGDSITTNVTMTSTTSGTPSSGPFQAAPLFGASAEWIIEDVRSDGAFVPFAGFPTNTFTGSAIQSGQSVTPSGAALVELVQDSELCSATISGTTITVQDS
ncbi:concanavalin A-like lectin/glucanase domain-containing protein [Roridomyces roridus]|uniref:Concanavalin A-like lectin/glucanase domain-containing protein n=1 Tax=Roridomyces roridus TaxID=1738132 RepID=A0AAD7FEQ0_9AGAR|nr:concanavalin A-like lectin/glucanase domain-containing protein [Roridomyces roridus]